MEDCFWKVKAIPYSMDAKLYGQLDYYAKTSETLANNAGDCEDKAILFASTLYRSFGKDPKVVFWVISLRFQGHAWVEMDDYVYDPAEGVKLTKSSYYTRYGAICHA